MQAHSTQRSFDQTHDSILRQLALTLISFLNPIFLAVLQAIVRRKPGNFRSRRYPDFHEPFGGDILRPLLFTLSLAGDVMAQEKRMTRLQCRDAAGQGAVEQGKHAPKQRLRSTKTASHPDGNGFPVFLRRICWKRHCGIATYPARCYHTTAVDRAAYVASCRLWFKKPQLEWVVLLVRHYERWHPSNYAGNGWVAAL